MRIKERMMDDRDEEVQIVLHDKRQTSEHTLTWKNIDLQRLIKAGISIIAFVLVLNVILIYAGKF